jgi:hypothetical protein
LGKSPQTASCCAHASLARMLPVERLVQHQITVLWFFVTQAVIKACLWLNKLNQH